jgi:HNH endonuclease
LVHIDADFWREIVLMAHWVRDAVILRWAEMTEDLSGSTHPLSVGDALELLLSTAEPLRSDAEVRAIYSRQKPLECVWSGKPLTQTVEVDHALPFALWQDSSSWNLFPADRKINNEKRDRIPSLTIIRKRKDSIISCWELLRENMPERFTFESRKLIGNSAGDAARTPNDWHTLLFAKFAEAVEFTAANRGALRWPAQP